MSAQKILIVDDERDLRVALRLSLEAAGFTVIEATDGIEGLATAEQMRPDLILLDITMPNMNGHQMLRAIRSKPWGRHIHIILLSNADDPRNVTQGITLRGNDYLIKSQTSLEDIVKKVKQHLAGYLD